jgi:hypothetical protein
LCLPCASDTWSRHVPSRTIHGAGTYHLAGKTRGKILNAKHRHPPQGKARAWQNFRRSHFGLFSNHYPRIILYKGHLGGRSWAQHVVKRTAFAMCRNVACPRNDLACLQLAQCLTHACPTRAHDLLASVMTISCLRNTCKRTHMYACAGVLFCTLTRPSG